jgi:hypothetical protein
VSEPTPAAPQSRLALVQPPLMISAAGESFAGALLALGALLDYRAFLAAFASALLFGGGAAFTAYFRLTTQPEATRARTPLSRLDAADLTLTRWLGWGLLLPGLLLAAAAGQQALVMATGVAVALMLYAAVTKPVWGIAFLNIAAARGLNFLLGISVLEGAVFRHGALALPIVFYAAGWAVLRASRQPGTPPTTGFIALLHLTGAVGILMYQAVNSFFRWTDALAFLVLFLGLTFPRFVRGTMEPRRAFVFEAVQYGFVGITLLAATLAAGQHGVYFGLVTAAFGLPVYAALHRWPISLIIQPR